MKKSSVKADISRNRLYITIGSRLSRQGLNQLYTDVRFCVADLQQGFAVITDLSDCTIAALSGVRTFKKLMNYLVANKVQQIVRVVDKNSLVLKQLLNLAASMQGYVPVYVSTIEEAELEIEKSDRRKVLRFHLYRQPVEFSVNGLKGNGFIHNISTNGCTIIRSTLESSVGDETLITLSFKKVENLSDEFQISGKIVRQDSRDTFAVQFEELASKRKEQLWDRLVYESQC